MRRKSFGNSCAKGPFDLLKLPEIFAHRARRKSNTSKHKRKEITMAWKRVENYWLGYSLPKKQFYFYYKLADESSVQQIFPGPRELLALADMFRNEVPSTSTPTGSISSQPPKRLGSRRPTPSGWQQTFPELRGSSWVDW